MRVVQLTFGALSPSSTGPADPGPDSEVGMKKPRGFNEVEVDHHRSKGQITEILADSLRLLQQLVTEGGFGAPAAHFLFSKLFR